MPRKRKHQQRRVKPADTRDSKRQTLITQEVQITAENMKRHQSSWREMFMRTEMPNIEKMIEITWKNLEYVLDVKDYSISVLLDVLQEAEDHRRRTNGVHAEVIDRSFEMYGDRLKAADDFFHRHTETLFAERIQEFQDVHYSRNKNETNLRKMNILANYRTESQLNTAKSNAISKVNAFVEDGRNERRLVTAELQKQLEDFWDKLRSTFSDYQTSTNERRKFYETLEKKDKSDRQTIIEQSLRIMSLLDEIAKFRGKIHSYKKTVVNELQDTIQQSHFFRDLYRRANASFTFGRRKDKQREITMSKEYNCSAERLKILTMKAKQILAYMQICRKYETEDEKILPPIVNYRNSVQMQTSDEFSTFNIIMDNFQTLVPFWHRFGFAQLLITELTKERYLLAMKNINLRTNVKQIFTQKSYSF